MNTKPKIKPGNLMIDKIMMTEKNKTNLANKLGYWPFPSQVKAVESSNAPDIKVVGDGLRFANPKTNKEVLLAGNVGGEKKTFNIRDPQSGVARFKLDQAAKIDETLGVTPEQIEELNKPEVKPTQQPQPKQNNQQQQIEVAAKRLNPKLSQRAISRIINDLLYEAKTSGQPLSNSDVYNYMRRENLLDDEYFDENKN
jgi:hypothetical protein